MTSPLRHLLPPWRLGKSVKSADEKDVERLSEGSVIVEWCFAVLVIAGVFGEFVIAAKNPASNSDLGRWGTAAADFLVGLGVAIELLASVVAHICQGELTERSNVRLGEANERAAKAERETAALKVKLENLKLPRFISEEQHRALVEGLKQVSAGPIYLRPGTQDSEAIEYGKAFQRAFEEAGRKFSPYPGGTPFFWSWSGVWLQVRDRYNPPKIAVELRHCLIAAGFDDPWCGTEDSHPENGVTLGIGSKV
jgi:hypothetical protein